ncbi:hypothetical protein [Streptomyces spongiae]|uniref:Uncharacterized protein n=1 Tax=Streptomyces spongiae TaxID=565072 RepID=A0A5N8XMF4_9ACTN|nr:hypothetical protein [Streptomyces spongiae]MPY60620.1 hypothetical protein [Streptomyces spongiae]
MLTGTHDEQCEGLELLARLVGASGERPPKAEQSATLINHDAAVRLYDLVADRCRQYDALSGNGNAEARGEARTKIEDLLPPDGWLGQVLLPSQGRILSADYVGAIFPSR